MCTLGMLKNAYQTMLAILDKESESVDDSYCSTMKIVDQWHEAVIL